MRVTLLGHASVLVELDGATCLMDPVLADPFEEGTVVSCPHRTVVHRIAASALVGWARRTRTFFSVRASSRRYGSARRLVDEGGRVALESRPLPDLLMYYVLRVAEGSELSPRHEVDRQLERLREQPAGSRPAPPDL